VVLSSLAVTGLQIHVGENITSPGILIKGTNASLFTSCTLQNKLPNLTNQNNIHAEITIGLRSENLATVLLRIFYLTVKVKGKDIPVTGHGDL
jgi:hypothetical protein